LISTVGLGLCLAGVVIEKSKPSMRVAEMLAVAAVFYGFFHSLMTIVLESGDMATLCYGIYMGIISTAAILFVRRAHLNTTHAA
jgi:hypothetical protein